MLLCRRSDTSASVGTGLPPTLSELEGAAESGRQLKRVIDELLAQSANHVVASEATCYLAARPF